MDKAQNNNKKTTHYLKQARQMIKVNDKIKLLHGKLVLKSFLNNG